MRPSAQMPPRWISKDCSLTLTDSLGAARLATRIRGELRDEGIKGVPAGPRLSTRQHSVGLTARQAEVLALMAEGLSNPEIADRPFISSRTAEHHVSAILSKLSAPTREEAVGIADELGVLASI